MSWGKNQKEAHNLASTTSATRAWGEARSPPPHPLYNSKSHMSVCTPSVTIYLDQESGPPRCPAPTLIIHHLSSQPSKGT